MSDKIYDQREDLYKSDEQWLRRMAAEKEYLDDLAHGLAYTHACSVIESHCLGAGEWFNVDRADSDAEVEVLECVKYLDMRGLIERDATRPSWIALRDESEARRAGRR